MVQDRKGVRQGCILSPCLFNLYAKAAMRVALDGYNKGFQIGGRVINNLPVRMSSGTPFQIFKYTTAIYQSFMK